MRKETDVKDKIITSYNEVTSAFEEALTAMNESCIEFIDSVDAAKSDELMDASILKKRMKEKVMEVLTDD